MSNPLSAALQIDNGAVSNITTTNALFSFNLVSTNGTNPVVTVFYGTSDGTTNIGSWASSNQYGTVSTGMFSTNINGLTPSQLYYFRWYAIETTNTFDWANYSSNFTTLAGVPTGSPPSHTYINVKTYTNGGLASHSNFFGANSQLINNVESDPVWNAVSNQFCPTSDVPNYETDPVWNAVSNQFCPTSDVPNYETDPVWNAVSNQFAKTNEPDRRVTLLNFEGKAGTDFDMNNKSMIKKKNLFLNALFGGSTLTVIGTNEGVGNIVGGRGNGGTVVLTGDPVGNTSLCDMEGNSSNIFDGATGVYVAGLLYNGARVYSDTSVGNVMLLNMPSGGSVTNNSAASMLLLSGDHDVYFPNTESEIFGIGDVGPINHSRALAVGDGVRTEADDSISSLSVWASGTNILSTLINFINSLNGDGGADLVGYRDSESLFDFLDDTAHKGILDAITVTDEGGLNISWTSGEIFDIGSTSILVTASSGSTSLTANAKQWLYWEGGTNLQTSTGKCPDGNCVIVAHVNTTIDDIISLHEESVYSRLLTDLTFGIRNVFPVRLTEGMVITTNGALSVQMSQGEYWHDLHNQHTNALLSTADTNLMVHYKVGGVWTNHMTNAVDINQWQNGANLTGVSAAKWYKMLYVGTDDNIHHVYGIAEYANEATALDSGIPPNPPGLTDMPTLYTYTFRGSDTTLSRTGANYEDIRPIDATSGGGAVNNLNSVLTVGPSAGGIEIPDLGPATAGTSAVQQQQAYNAANHTSMNYTVTYSSTNIVMDCTQGKYQTVSLTNNARLNNFTNMIPGCYVLYVNQPDTNAFNITSYGSFFAWAEIGVPTVTTASNKNSVMAFLVPATNMIYGSANTNSFPMW